MNGVLPVAATSIPAVQFTSIKRYTAAEQFLTDLTPWGAEQPISGYIFRGEPSSKYQLVPSALRPTMRDKLWQLAGLSSLGNQHETQYYQILCERLALNNFFRLANSNGLYLPQAEIFQNSLHNDFPIIELDGSIKGDSTWIPNELLDFAGLAQHYGIPTRLLDWTYDPLVAAYFAASGVTDDQADDDIVVWGLDAQDVGTMSHTVSYSNLKFINPPYYGNPNLNAQKGLFTHWPEVQPSLRRQIEGADPGIDRISLDRRLKDHIEHVEWKFGRSTFIKRLIPVSQSGRLLRLLSEAGYNPARLFPGYGGVASALNQKSKFRH